MKLKARIKKLEKRVQVLERLVLAQTIGMIEVGGDMHLLECEKRNDEKKACTCGAVPVGCSNRAKGSDE